MRTLLVLGLVAGLLGVIAAPASAATPTDRKVAALAKQLTALQKQVKTLQKQVVFLRNEVSANYAGDACGLALTSDMFQVSWAQIDTHSSAPFFGAQTQVSDRGACNDIEPAVPRSLTAPPKTNIFQPLINWVYG
jgi:Tfp pilus assembly protein FimV